jgi:hypothetical protein
MIGMIETLGGLWCLLELAIKTRCRLRGSYWRWRMETAFGRDAARPVSRWQRWRAMIEYGRWVYRMKRSMR